MEKPATKILKQKISGRIDFKKSGQFMKSFRESIRATQRELADSAGCNSQFVSNWERGLCAPPAHVLRAIRRKYSSFDSESFVSAIAQDHYDKAKAYFTKVLRVK